MAERVNRRRKLTIRTRVSRREKEQLLSRRRAMGSRTWRDFMFEIAAARGAGAVDLSEVAKLAAVVVALGEGPRQMRKAASTVSDRIGELGQLLLLNADRADMHREAIVGLIREAQTAILELRVAGQRAEFDASEARAEIARVMKAVAAS